MSFQALIDNGIIEPIPVNNDEIEAILNMVSKDLTAAKILLKEEQWDWAHNISYNAIRQACLALAYAHGYRPIGEAKHKHTFVFAEAALGPRYGSDMRRIDKMRRQRNLATYQVGGTVSKERATQNFEFAERFTQEVMVVIRALLEP